MYAGNFSVLIWKATDSPNYLARQKELFSAPAHTDGYKSVGTSSHFTWGPEQIQFSAPSVHLWTEGCGQISEREYPNHHPVLRSFTNLDAAWVLVSYQLFGTEHRPHIHMYKGQNVQEEIHLVPWIWDQAPVPKPQQQTTHWHNTAFKTSTKPRRNLKPALLCLQDGSSRHHRDIRHAQADSHIAPIKCYFYFPINTNMGLIYLVDIQYYYIFWPSTSAIII
jgi:hypothetical protein